MNQRLVALQLRKLGLGADFASTGLEALAAIAARDYDVVLMDCQMPELDGYQTTRRLRDDPRHADLHIIAHPHQRVVGFELTAREFKGP